MDSKVTTRLPDHLWLERKSELNNIVRKNILTYSFLNSFWVLLFLGLSSADLGYKFPTATFWGFVGGNIMLGILVRRFVLSKGQKGNKSRKKQYLVLMAWQNFFIIIMMLFFIGAAVSNWLSSDHIRLSMYWLAALIIPSIIIFIRWIPRKRIFLFNSEIANHSDNNKPSNYRYLWIIGLLILLSRTISRMVIPDVRSFLIITVGLTGGIWAIYFVMYVFYRDYLLWKNGFLD